MINIFKRSIYAVFIIMLAAAIMVVPFLVNHMIAVDYAENRDRYVPITANVSYISESHVVSKVKYDIYVSYSYNKDEYSMVHYKSTEKNEFEVGTEVAVKIDSENPGKLLDDDISVWVVSGKIAYIIWPFMAGIIFVGLTASELSVIITYRKRKKLYDDFTLSLDKVKNDIDVQYRCKKVLKIVLTLIVFVAKVVFMAFIYFKTYAWLMLCIELVSIVLLLIYTCKSLISEGKNNKTINIVQDTLKIKEVLESDSDGGYSLVKKYSFYILGDWHAEDDCLISFKKEEVEQLKTNTRFYIAVNAKNKILRIFDCNEFKKQI